MISQPVKPLQRKIIKQGTDSLTITLPREWTSAYNLGGGDLVTVTQQDGNLVCSAQPHPTKTSISYHLTSSNEKHIKILITNLYRGGYEKITITWDNVSCYETITSVVHDYLFGFEITQRSNESCVLENIATGEQEKTVVILRRIFYMVLELFDQLAAPSINITLVSNQVKHANRLINLCWRNAMLSPQNLRVGNAHVLLIRHMVPLVNIFTHLVEYLHSHKMNLPKNFIDLIPATKELFKKLEEGFFSSKTLLLEEVQRRAPEFQEKEIFILMKNSSHAICYHYLAEIVRTTYFISSSALLLILLKNQNDNS